MKLNAIILAAGKGRRMNSLDVEKSKVSYEILSKPIVRYVIDELLLIKPKRIITVVGAGGEITKSIVEKDSEIVWQKEMLGTGHALMQAEPLLKSEEGITLVCCGDTPLLKSESIEKLIKEHISHKNDLTVLVSIVKDPKGYGRILRNMEGVIEEIKEESDCNEHELNITEVNAGVYVFNNSLLMKYLFELKSNNAQKELYLTDLLAIFKHHGHKVGASSLKDSKEMQGVNDRVQLYEATKEIKKRINFALMRSGVTLIDPKTTYIGPDVKIAQDTIIYPNTHIYGTTIIGQGNVIGPDNYIVNMEIGNFNTIYKSYLFDSIIKDSNVIGPYSHLRGHCLIENGCKIGNFVEFKNTHFKDGSKCSHLSYLGDSEVGSNVNIGCGTITANYDGKNKFKTKIGENVFVGSGSTLIAPLTIEDDAFVAAGSTINQDVDKDDLAIARARQVNKKGYAKKYHK